MESIGNSINLKCNKDMRSLSFPNLFDWIKAAKVIDENNIQNAKHCIGYIHRKSAPNIEKWKAVQKC
jgi:hypothetical protein